MKLATVKDGTRDGRLAVISRDLQRAVLVPDIAPTMQAAIDNWDGSVSELRQVAESLESGCARDSFEFCVHECMAPLPRAYQWVDGSAYVNHVELLRAARGASMPPAFWTDPLVYQGGSDDFLGPTADAPFVSQDDGIDLEAELAVIVDDVPMGTSADEARPHIKLLMLANDWSLRERIVGEIAKGFGFYQSKPATAFSPVAVTPDELGDAWDGGKVTLPMLSFVNATRLGSPLAGVDMVFDFPFLISHVTKTRNARAGTIIGSGTISNRDRTVGSSCIAERRALELLEHGRPVTPFLGFGDVVRIEMFDPRGKSVFGAIEQRVVPASNRR